ncbi:hypothetical protein UlMin_035057 [Ulmus minor]
MSCVLSFFLFIPPFVLLAVAESKAKVNVDGGIKSCEAIKEELSVARIGGVINLKSRMGKEQKIAMEMARDDISRSTCAKLDLHLKDSQANPARAAASAIDLIRSKQVEVVVGTLTLQEAALVSETYRKFPFVSLTSAAISLELNPFQSTTFFQMANDVVFQTQCIAAIVGYFQWRKVTAIHEHNNGFSSSMGSGIITLLSDSLRSVNSEIENHKAFPSLSSLSNPQTAIEEELKLLKSKSNRVFIVLQFSYESALLLFKKAKQMGMMEKGYVWIISDEIASLLDSTDAAVKLNMQGVLGIKTTFEDSRKAFGHFRNRFRRFYGSKYPEEEEHSSPSIFALRAYDAICAISQALRNLQENFTPKDLSETLLSINFRGLSGKIRFKNGTLSQSPTFQIINVVGKSYREVAFWSAANGFSENLVEHNNGSIGALTGPIYWPGGQQTVPEGWILSDEENQLRIGVPAKAAFNNFVKVSYNEERNTTSTSGFSIDVFTAVVELLPYQLNYVLVPFNGSYDDMIKQVYYKSFDAAIGDIGIFTDRYRYVDYSQPYLSSGLEMVVTVKPDKVKETWMFMKAFTKKMWLQMVFMHFSICSVVWFIENLHGKNHELKGLGAMLWFSITILFFAQREPLKCNLARLVLAPWLFVILVVSASFTANLTSMLTVSQVNPSVPDIETLQRMNAPVGCNGNSFIIRYLVNVLNFKQENIVKISTMDDYPEYFAKGDIAAAFLGAPHAKVFLAKYCKGYMIAGPLYHLGGLGFTFPKGSPLAIDISESILELTESGEVGKMEKALLSSFNCSSSLNLGSGISIGPEPFSGLFRISGCISAIAFLVTSVRLVTNYVDSWSCIYNLVLIIRGFWRWVYLNSRDKMYKFDRSKRNSNLKIENQNGVLEGIDPDPIP